MKVLKQNGQYTITVNNPGFPFLACAIHQGHQLSRNVEEYIALSDAERLREEDPYTNLWAMSSPNHLIVHSSRFEIDFNRPIDQCIYLKPEDAWGLHIWKKQPTEKIIHQTRKLHKAFYHHLKLTLNSLLTYQNKIIVLDIHSYNYKRQGPARPEADPELNPEFNIGTGTMDRSFWAPIVDQLIHSLHHYQDKHWDVRENIKFQGGYFPKWIHHHYPKNVCCLSIEVKKVFMDEWTGHPCEQDIQAIQDCMKATYQPLLETLNQLNKSGIK